MIYPVLPHDVNSPTHPVSAMDYMPVEPLRALQLHRLQWTVKYAYERVPLFRKRCEERGVRPEHIKTLADIKLLPFSKKVDLRDEYPMGLRAASMDEIVRFHCSSGTTGKPICIPNTKGDIDVWADAAARCLTMYGLSPDDILQVSYGYGLFTGGLGLHYGAEYLGATALPVSTGNTKRQIQLFQDFGSTILCCTPSYAMYLGETMRDMGISTDSIKLRAGIFGAEPWSVEMKKQIEALLGIKAYDIYGLSEIAGPGVSFDCGEGMLHINEDYFYPEVIDPETLLPVPDGTVGELVFTCIGKEALPLIRYRTRDLTRLQTAPCPCGKAIIRPNCAKAFPFLLICITTVCCADRTARIRRRNRCCKTSRTTRTPRLFKISDTFRWKEAN